MKAESEQQVFPDAFSAAQRMSARAWAMRRQRRADELAETEAMKADNASLRAQLARYQAKYGDLD